MRIILSAAVLTSVLTPTFSLSYLDKITGANPSTLAASDIINKGAAYYDAVKATEKTLFNNVPTNDFINGATSFFDEMNGAAVQISTPFPQVAPDAFLPEPAVPEPFFPEPADPEFSAGPPTGAAFLSGSSPCLGKIKV